MVQFLGSPSPTWRPTGPDLAEYWSWAGVALYLHLPLDLLTSLAAAQVVGIAAEANPWMRWLLVQDIVVLVGLQLAVLGVLVALFVAYFRLLESAAGAPAWVLARSYECWIGLVIAAGLFVFGNNVSVIVLGSSLV